MRAIQTSFLVLLLSLTGCSRDDSGRVDMWGTVTFQGQPVPTGLIVINPDLSKGNDGPQGMAEIKNGRYDTRSLEKGAPSGPVVLVIDGFDGMSQGDATSGKPLFIGYKAQFELPKAPSERNIEVPDSAAVNAGRSYGAVP
jgi:hypothetical protein